MIKSIAFSVYPVSDMARAKAFYENVLKLKPADTLGESWQEYDLDGQTFGIVLMTEDAPEPYKGTRGTTIAFEVDDLNATLEAMQREGVPVVYGPMDFPTCRMFVVTDPDNNVITFHQLAAGR